MRTLLLAWLVACFGCATAGHADLQRLLDSGDWAAAISRYEQRRDPMQLRAIAVAMIERAALSDEADTRRLALRELRLTGTRGVAVWRHLVNPSAPDEVRHSAWVELARRGDLDARDALRPALAQP